MNGESKLITIPSLQFHGHTSNTVIVIHQNTPRVLSFDMLRVVLAFAAPTTVETAYRALDADCDLQTFAAVVDELVTQGMLTPARAQAPSLLSLLETRIDRTALQRSLSSGALVVIPDAFPLDLADRVWSDLHEARWIHREGDGYCYETAELADSGSDVLAHVFDMWQSSKTDMSELIELDCYGDSQATASWYRSSLDYASPHSDSVMGHKMVAFNWYLGRSWRREWGGDLYWCPTGQRMMPVFNTVALWKILPRNLHSVCPVTASAKNRRMAINGFWTSASSQPKDAPTAPAESLVTKQAYGHDLPVVVL